MNQNPSCNGQYDTLAIRKLLTTAFSDEEFTIFCYDHFPNVYKEFTSGMVFAAKVQLLVDQCNRKNLFGELLPLVQESNPNQYEAFRPSLQNLVQEGGTQFNQQEEGSLDEKVQLSSAIQVFISYSHKDLNAARKLAEDLQKAGFAVWWAVSDLRGGDSWGRTIQAALEVSKICLVLLSPASIQSEWVEKEYLYAMELGLKVIPLLYQDCKRPLALANKQYIDFRDDYKGGLYRLFTALREGTTHTTTTSSTIPYPIKKKQPILLRYPIWQIIGVGVVVIGLFLLLYTFWLNMGFREL